MEEWSNQGLESSDNGAKWTFQLANLTIFGTANSEIYLKSLDSNPFSWTIPLFIWKATGKLYHFSQSVHLLRGKATGKFDHFFTQLIYPSVKQLSCVDFVKATQVKRHMMKLVWVHFAAEKHEVMNWIAFFERRLFSIANQNIFSVRMRAWPGQSIVCGHPFLTQKRSQKHTNVDAQFPVNTIWPPTTAASNTNLFLWCPSSKGQQKLSPGVPSHFRHNFSQIAILTPSDGGSCHTLISGVKFILGCISKIRGRGHCTHMQGSGPKPMMQWVKGKSVPRSHQLSTRGSSANQAPRMGGGKVHLTLHTGSVKENSDQTRSKEQGKREGQSCFRKDFCFSGFGERKERGFRTVYRPIRLPALLRKCNNLCVQTFVQDTQELLHAFRAQMNTGSNTTQNKKKTTICFS